MRDVGVRDFRNHVSEYLSGGELLAVRKHGRLLGFYLPARRKSDTEELQAAVRDLGESLAELRRETGLSEEELVEGLVSKEREDRGRERVGG
ncbi:MAG: hypothetical protein ACFB50_13525 [Rubrobacteraceae bacterium]